MRARQIRRGVCFTEPLWAGQGECCRVTIMSLKCFIRGNNKQSNSRINNVQCCLMTLQMERATAQFIFLNKKIFYLDICRYISNICCLSPNVPCSEWMFRTAPNIHFVGSHPVLYNDFAWHGSICLGWYYQLSNLSIKGTSHIYPVTPLLSLICCHCPLKPDILDILLTIFEVPSVEAWRGTGLVPVDAADRGAWNWHRDG